MMCKLKNNERQNFSAEKQRDSVFNVSSPLILKLMIRIKYMVLHLETALCKSNLPFKYKQVFETFKRNEPFY